MTVAEAIERLMRLPQGLELWVEDNEYGPFPAETPNVAVINVKNVKGPDGKWERVDKEVVKLG